MKKNPWWKGKQGDKSKSKEEQIEKCEVGGKPKNYLPGLGFGTTGAGIDGHFCPDGWMVGRKWEGR